MRGVGFRRRYASCWRRGCESWARRCWRTAGTARRVPFSAGFPRSFTNLSLDLSLDLFLDLSLDHSRPFPGLSLAVPRPFLGLSLTFA